MELAHWNEARQMIVCTIGLVDKSTGETCATDLTATDVKARIAKFEKTNPCQSAKVIT